MSLERRGAPRVPVSMKVDRADGEPLAFGYAKDISSKGMALEAMVLLGHDKLPKSGDAVAIKFMLPGSQVALTVRAEVLRVDIETGPPCIALAFVNLDKLALREIEHYVVQEPPLS